MCSHLFQGPSSYSSWTLSVDQEGPGVPPCSPSQRASEVLQDLRMEDFQQMRMAKPVCWPSSLRAPALFLVSLLSTRGSAWLSQFCPAHLFSQRSSSQAAHDFGHMTEEWRMSHIKTILYTASLRHPSALTLMLHTHPEKLHSSPGEVLCKTSPFSFSQSSLGGGTAASSPFWNSTEFF